MSYSTSFHVGYSYQQYFTMWNLNADFWCRVIRSLVPECCYLSPNIYNIFNLQKTEYVQFYICDMRNGSTYYLQFLAENKSLMLVCIISPVYTSLLKEDSCRLHLSGRPRFSHSALKRREYAINWVKTKYNIVLSVASSLQGTG